jgi:hypothetical protein
VSFTTRENDGQVCRRSGSRRPYCYGRAGERAVRLTTFPVLADGFHRRHGPRAPSRGPLSFRRRIGRRAPTRLRLEHLLVTDSVRGSLESAPARRTSRRRDRRFASREGHERCDRIEMLSIVHHSFARVRITPRHARVEPGRPSSCYGGRWLYRVLGAFVTIRSGPCSGPAGCPAGSEARRSRGREEIDADLSMGGVVEWLGGGDL